MNQPFTSLESFRIQFNQGLHELLDKQQLGTFILCLANATNDPELFEQLKLKLKAQYHYLLNIYQQALTNGEKIDAVEEDLLVFLKLHTLSFENIKLTQLRDESPWLCQFNLLRSFRPKRISNFKYAGEISTPFVETQFHFNKPFMAKECFWSGQYQGKQLDLFYNKYPFADLHGLIVPERTACMPQFLTEEYHFYIWQVTKAMSITLPGIALGYNSYGAYASVNHLHFQMFVLQQGLPVSLDRWVHNGGLDEYPLKIKKLTDMHHAWCYLDGLHYSNQPYNLLYMPDALYVFPRKVQESVEVPEWSSGFTWYELSGAMLLSNKQNYSELSHIHITDHIEKHSV